MVLVCGRENKYTLFLITIKLLYSPFRFNFMNNIRNLFNPAKNHILRMENLEQANGESAIFSLSSQLKARGLYGKNGFSLRKGIFANFRLLEYFNFYDKLRDQGINFPKPVGIFKLYEEMNGGFYPGLITINSPNGIGLREIKESKECLIFPVQLIFEEFEENIKKMKEFGNLNREVFFNCAKYSPGDDKIYFDFYGNLKDFKKS